MVIWFNVVVIANKSCIYKIKLYNMTKMTACFCVSMPKDVYQSALDNVSEEVQESAKLDGISSMQNIFYIILPIIKETIMTNTMLITLMTLGGFGMIYVMTGGGPGTATQTLPVLMYIRAFKNYQLGYGTAISMILLVLSVLFSIFYTRVAGKEMEEGA